MWRSFIFRLCVVCVERKSGMFLDGFWNLFGGIKAYGTHN
jgi:hypothetical protein